jgi:hypothetical protein
MSFSAHTYDDSILKLPYISFYRFGILVASIPCKKLFNSHEDEFWNYLIKENQNK